MASLADTLGPISARLGELEGDPVPLEGGITNRNYRVRFAGEDVVVRLPGKDTGLLGIDRVAERVAGELAAQAGGGPGGGGVVDGPALLNHGFHRRGADRRRGAARAGDGDGGRGGAAGA